MASDMPPPAVKQPLNSNADFRKLLETPRPNRGGDGSIYKGAKVGKSDGKPKKKSGKPKPVQEEKEDEGPTYRDRAEERRKGFNPDYEQEAMETGGISATANLNGISVEESKFLGGDMDHTHLVKGLDYAYLQKVRGEMAKKDEDGGEAKKPSRKREVVKFSSAAGRAVFNAVFSRSKVQTNDLFLPGRTAFVFDLETGSSSDVPTTLRRSKADCPEAVETMMGGMDTQVLERMVKIMSYMRGSSGKGSKLKRKEKLRMLQMMDGLDQNGVKSQVRPDPEEPAQPSGPVDVEEDIFGDAGRDIVIEHVNRKHTDKGATSLPPPPPPMDGPSAGPMRPSGGYDAAAAAYAAYGEEEEAPPPPPPPPSQPQDEIDDELDRLGGFAPMPPSELDPPQTIKPKQTEDEIIEKETDDAYGECYPGYGGFSGALVDSDDEDLTHMDNKEGKSRYDFGTEQEWEKYKSNKEMMPKAAFQFGVKMSDGRKAHNKLGKQVEQKEQQQLRKIQTIFKENHGDRYKKAFEDDNVPEDAERKGRSKKRRI